MKFLREIFQDAKDSYSHKRTITLLSFLCIVASWVASTFFGIPPIEFLIDNFMYIVIGGMGIATAEPLMHSNVVRKKDSPSE